jgi:hypothetical protein
MKNLFSILFFMLLTFSLTAQDIIIKNDGSEISAKVLEISKTEVRFKKMDNVDGPTYIMSVNDLLMIRPSKGTNIVFKKEVVKPDSPSVPNTTSSTGQLTSSTAEEVVAKSPVSAAQEPNSTSNSEDSCDKGTQDAKKHYTGVGSGAGWVGLTTAIFSPIVGGITGAIVSSTKPDYANLNIPKPNLVNNSNYMGCYQNEAHKTKKSKVWTSFGTGALVWSLILLLASTTGK